MQSITSLNWNWTLTAVNYCKHRSHTHDFRWSTLWTSARFIARICGGEGKIYWRWGKREWGWSFLKSYDEFGGEGLKIISAFSKWLPPPSPPQQMNDQPSDSTNRPTKPVVFKICLKGSLWRCKKGHTFWKLTVQLTRFAACEIKREIVKETNRGPRGMARRSIVNILSRHWYRTLPHKD